MLVLLGKSASGKDSIAKELMNMGYNRIITFTNRPIRPNEVDGVDYHYITTEEFLKKQIDNEFLESRYYETTSGLWFYGSAYEDYTKADNNTICILTPSGLKQLKKKHIDNISFYIDVFDKTIKQRQIEREDEEKEARRRFNSDKVEFKHIEDWVDYKMKNENISVKDIAAKIDKAYKERING